MSEGYQLEDLQRRIPVIGDKILIDLVNGIHINQDIIGYRRRRGALGRIIDTLAGKDYERQILLDGNLTGGQEALRRWILELSDSLRISQVALRITQNSLLEISESVNAERLMRSKQQKSIMILAKGLSELSQQLQQKIGEFEQRFEKLEIKVAAKDDLDSIFSEWAAGRIYSQLPRILQIVLLCKQIFSSSVSFYEFKTGDVNYFRKLLLNKILAEMKDLPKQWFKLSDFLASAYQGLDGQTTEVVGDVLEIRSIPFHRLAKLPHLFVVGTTLEMAALPAKARPSNISDCAIEISRLHFDLSYTTDAKGFVSAVIKETAEESLATVLKS